MNSTLKNKQAQLVDDLKGIATEGQNPDTLDLDMLSTQGVLEKINNEDQKVSGAVYAVIPQITQAVDKIVSAFANGGRLIYIGAGTSGRLGVLDAVECPPTFSVSSEQVIGIIAGGAGAIYKAVEGAEDNENFAIADLKTIQFNDKDILVGIAASGRTPYVLSAMKYAQSLGANVIGVSCSPKQGVDNIADISICVEVGAEALTGSTRMKSGTAQKLILNMLSTASMIRSGKIYRNLMIDVNASNEKLYARAVRIVMQATGADYTKANQALEEAENNAKLATLMILTGKSVQESKNLLTKTDGFLRKAVQQAKD